MKNMNEIDVRVHNDIMKTYMSDAQFERMTEEHEVREIDEDEYRRLRVKLY